MIEQDREDYCRCFLCGGTVLCGDECYYLFGRVLCADCAFDYLRGRKFIAGDVQ